MTEEEKKLQEQQKKEAQRRLEEQEANMTPEQKAKAKQERADREKLGDKPRGTAGQFRGGAGGSGEIPKGGASQELNPVTPYPDPYQPTPDEAAARASLYKPKTSASGHVLDAGQIERGTDETENPDNAERPPADEAHRGRRQQTPGTFTR